MVNTVQPPLSNKSALILGIADDIGTHTALKLALAGCKIIGFSADPVELARVSRELADVGGTFYPLQANPNNRAEVVAMVKTLFEKFKGVDFVVNVSGR